jgi:adenylate kinase
MANTIKLTGESNIIVTGKSGAGKQPRIDVLVDEFGLEQLSTGNIFRHYLGLFNGIEYPRTLDEFWSEEAGGFIPDTEIRSKLTEFLADANKGTECGGPGDDDDEGYPNIEDIVLGMKAKYFVEKGLFVPDDLVNDLLKASFAKNEFRRTVLDGFPRTINQSEYLLEMMKEVGETIDLVLVVDNEDDLIISRTMGRRICPKCNKVYHTEFKPPNDDGTCKECGTAVILRSDDSEEKIRSRLNEFSVKCIPAIDFLKNAGIPVAHVNGNLEVFTKENVRNSVLASIDSAK